MDEREPAVVNPDGHAVQVKLLLAGPPGETNPWLHGLHVSPSLPAGQMICRHVPWMLLHTPLEPQVAYGVPW